MKITLLYQVSHYIRVKKQRNIKSWDQQNDLVIRGFCYIRPLYNEVPLYNINITCTRYVHGSAIKFHTQIVVLQVRCAKSTIPRTMSDIRVLILLLFVCIFQGPRLTPNTGMCVCVCVCVCVIQINKCTSYFSLGMSQGASSLST